MTAHGSSPSPSAAAGWIEPFEGRSRAPLIRRAAGALVPGGILHPCLDTGIGHCGRDKVRQMRVDGCLTTLVRPEEIIAVVREAGLVPVSARTRRGRMVDGTPTEFHILLARKPA